MSTYPSNSSMSDPQFHVELYRNMLRTRKVHASVQQTIESLKDQGIPVSDIVLIKEMYTKAIVYDTFINKVFGAKMNACQTHKYIHENMMPRKSKRQLSIGDKITFQVAGTMCNGMQIDKD